MVPVYGQVGSSIIYSGVLPHIGMMGLSNIPNYWHIRYCTGFDVPPGDLIDFISRMVAINILLINADILLGVAGINSFSLSLDGLSQSTSTQGFAQRIQTYLQMNQAQLVLLKNKYKGFLMTAL